MNFLTYTGKSLDFSNPQPEQIAFEDIVIGLVRQPRFSGQSKINYVVAEHSLLVAALVPENYAGIALLHDASEAYMSDIVSPLKNLPELKGYRELEERLLFVILEKYINDPLFSSIPTIVKEADRIAFEIERDWFNQYNTKDARILTLPLMLSENEPVVHRMEYVINILRGKGRHNLPELFRLAAKDYGIDITK